MTDEEKKRNNEEYLKMLDESIKQLENGEVVIKTIEELDAMTE